MSTTQRRPGLLVMLRDALSYLGGWALLDSQVGIFRAPPPHPSETAMWIAALLIGVPGVAQIIMWRFGGGTPTVMPSQPPPPASAESSAPPSSS